MTKQFTNRSSGRRLILAFAGCAIAFNAWLPGPALAASAKEIDAGVDEALVKFEKEVKRRQEFPR